MADPRGFEPLASAFGGLRSDAKYIEIARFFIGHLYPFALISRGFCAYLCGPPTPLPRLVSACDEGCDASMSSVSCPARC